MFGPQHTKRVEHSPKISPSRGNITISANGNSVLPGSQSPDFTRNGGGTVFGRLCQTDGSVDTRGSGDMNDGFASHGIEEEIFLWL